MVSVLECSRSWVRVPIGLTKDYKRKEMEQTLVGSE